MLVHSSRRVAPAAIPRARAHEADERFTTAVVRIAAALSPHDAWQQPLLRAVDTAAGIAIGLAVSWLAGKTLAFAHGNERGAGRLIRRELPGRRA
jgi:hypothetical protein